MFGLAPGTTYYFRLVATNAQGTSVGTVRSFTTPGPPSPPTAVTLPATGVANTTADLHAQVDPRASQTAYTFEYGTSTSFGTITPVVALDDASVPEPADASLSGLQPDTTYYFRVVATNANGTSAGVVRSFTTGPGGAPIVTTGAASDADRDERDALSHRRRARLADRVRVRIRPVQRVRVAQRDRQHGRVERRLVRVAADQRAGARDDVPLPDRRDERERHERRGVADLHDAAAGDVTPAAGEQLEHVPFNRPYYVGDEHEQVLEAIAAGHISASGTFTERCERELEAQLGAARVLLTPSCTAALELAAMLLDIGPGDEVIMPSFTFTSTANAFALRGAVPVFVDIREDTLNLDEQLVEAAITPRTRAIVPVHYAGVGCEMAALLEIAERHGLTVVEDAAHAAMATHRAQPLGTFGRLGTLSFHETKNLTCGEGGALIVCDPRLVARAEILRDKGTNRSAFLRGEVDRYTWVDLGSSMGLSDLNAAFLWAQLRDAGAITAARLRIWDRYHRAFAELEGAGVLRRPVIPASSGHNAHMYYLLLEDRARRDGFIAALREPGRRRRLSLRPAALVAGRAPARAARAGRLRGRRGSQTASCGCRCGRR